MTNEQDRKNDTQGLEERGHGHREDSYCKSS